MTVRHLHADLLSRGERESIRLIRISSRCPKGPDALFLTPSTRERRRYAVTGSQSPNAFPVCVSPEGMAAAKQTKRFARKVAVDTQRHLPTPEHPFDGLTAAPQVPGMSSSSGKGRHGRDWLP